jgi:hypothetical protein
MKDAHALTRVLPRQVLGSSPYTVLQARNFSILVLKRPYFVNKKILKAV